MSKSGTMKSGTMGNEEEIFDLARQIESPDVRAAYVAQACGNDGELAKRINELLAIHLTADPLLDDAPVDLGLTKELDQSSIESEGETIGPYQLLQKLGEGGFGVVFMAEQTKPIRRKVALKIIKPGMESDEVIARFEAERQALAMMSHPNIASVIDGGRTPSGRPYFVMELVRGVSITEYCDKKHLAPPERIRLFNDVCSAVHHAHQKGIIHRDIKPSNVMVTLHDGKPVAKVIDFGVAKAISQRLTEKLYFTRYGQMIGTPQYMSPEQAEMSGLGIDTLSDVYSLGVLLYELLIGTTPIREGDLREAGFKEMQRLICEEELARPSRRLSTTGQQELSDIAAHRGITPSKLAQVVSGDLEWIVMKTLEKERNRRYSTPRDLAKDLERYLDDQPVEARPPSIRYRLGKSIRRHRGFATAVLAITAILVTTSIFSTWMWRNSVRQRFLTEQRNVELESERRINKALIDNNNILVAEKSELVDKLQGQLYDEHIRAARDFLSRSDWLQARVALEKCPQHLRDWEFKHLNYLAHSSPNSIPCEQLAMFLDDGKTLVSLSNRGGTGKLIFWDTQNLEQTRSPIVVSANDALTMAAMHPDQTQVVAGSTNGNLYLVDLRSGAVKRLKGVHSDRIDGIGYHPSGTIVASTSWDGSIVTTDTVAMKTINREQLGSGRLRCAEFDPSGSHLATAAMDKVGGFGAVFVLESKSLSAVTRIEIGERSMKTVHFSDDGKWLAAGGLDGAAIWSTKDWKMIRELPLEEQAVSTEVYCVRFRPDSKSLAVASGSHVRFYDLQENQFTSSVSAPILRAYWCEFTPDGDSVAIYGDGQTHLRSVHDENLVAPSGITYLNFRGLYMSAEFSRSGKYLATSSANRVVTIWDTASARPVRSFVAHTSNVLDLVWDIDDRLIGRQADGTLQAYDLEQGILWKTSTAPYPRELYSQRTLAAHPTKPECFVGIERQGIFRFDSQTGELRETVVELEHELSAVAVSPDGQWLAWSENAPTAELWNLVDAERGPSLSMNTERLREIVFSPDSRKLAGVSPHKFCEVDLASKQQWGGDHWVQLYGVAYSKSGKRLFLSPGTKDSSVKIYDTDRRTIVDTVSCRSCWDIAFCQETETLAYLGSNGTLCLFPTQRAEADRSNAISSTDADRSPGPTPYENYQESRRILFDRDGRNDDMARQLAQSAFDAVPDCTEYRLMYGAALCRAGDTEKSLEILDGIETLPWQCVNWGDPSRESLMAYAHAIRAMAHVNLGDTQQATDQLDRLDESFIKTAPKFVTEAFDEARTMIGSELTPER